VAGDSGRLRQILWNLAANGVKFTDPGGVVRITVDCRNGDARVEVCDTGAGISPRFLPRIFDRFVQADSSATRAHGGLGLGLAIVAHLVERHGGTIRASSAGLGKGATFTVILPRIQDADAAAADAGAGRAAPAPDVTAPVEGRKLQGVRVLLVDDDAPSREALGETLAGRGATVDAAASVDEAFAKLDAAQPDVILCDVAMPERDGFSLVRQLRTRPGAEGGQIPVAALTAHAGGADRTRALAAGFQLHLAKPVDADDLTAAVLDLARGRSERAD
jgi:CheY-like chemotaxis protein